MSKPSIKKLSIVILAIILLIAGYFVFFQKPETAAADWWDDSWLYRQTVAIANSGTAQTDFQVMITLDSATLITANKIQSDCDDIRITDINGKLIPHWIEPTTCNTATTKIWTKVPSISTSGDTVYLYYGNSAVDSKSSTTDTFIREISGVQGAWDMDGTGAIATNDTLADSSGNTNTGTASNVNTTGMAYASSQFEQGVDFDGEDDFVSVADHDSLDMGNGSFTLETWFNTEAYPIGFAYRNLFYKGGTYRADIISHASTSKYSLSMIVNSGGGDQQIYTNYVYDYNAGWHHIIFVRDKSSNKLYIYRNGVLVTEGSDTSSNLDNSGNLQIGSSNFNGSIDNVRVYNTALTSTEISDLYGTGGDRHGYVTTNYPNKSLVRKYSASVTIDPPTGEERGPGPVAYWKFDEGFGQTANDSTINANNGTLGATSGVEASDPTWQTEDMCVSGKCLKFDGVDDYIRATNLASLSEFSVNLWIKTTISGGILAEYCDGATSCISTSNYDRIIYMNDSGNIVFSIYIGGYGMTSITSANAYSDDTFHYVSAVIGTGGMKLYVDSALVASNALTSAASSNYKWYIGSGSTSGYPDRPTNDKFNGFIDSVKIYPYARTAAQIKADYASRGTGSGVSAMIGGSTSGTGGQTSLSDGLVGYWKMDEASWNGTADEVVDSSGSGNDGVAVGATGIPTTGAGKFGNGGVFDGVDDHVSVADDESTDITSGTVSVWVKFLADEDWNEELIAKSRSDSSSRILYGIVEQGTWKAVIASGLASKVVDFGSHNLNKWYHLSFTFENLGATTEIKTYMDGVFKNSDTADFIVGSDATWGYAQADNHIGIGAHGAGTSLINCDIDEVRIYNRALSPGEVRDLYNFAPGPVGWWKMDEKVSGNGQTINDYSGYGNTGTTSSANGTGMDCMVPGKYGSGCEFDGVDDYVGIGTPLSATSGTISLWMYTNDLVQETRMITDTGGYIYIKIYGGAGAVRFDYHDGSGKFTPYKIISANEWTHVTGVWGDAGYIRLYINGNLVGSTLAGDLGSVANPVQIGGMTTGGFFNGSIDDVRIYNYARTQAQIMEDYSAGAGRKQPVGHWKFDEGYGTTANNSGIGGSALNGTLTNMDFPATSTSGWTDEGKMGKGLVFDGADDYVDCGNITELNTQIGSIEFWYKHTIIPATYQDALYIYQASQTDYLLIRMEDDRIRLVSEDGDIVQFSAYWLMTPDTNWHHIVWVQEGGTIRLHYDGDEKAVTGGSSSWWSNNLTSWTTKIGKAGWTNGFNGSIDDVKIYNFALTEDEVRKEYNQGALLKLGSTGTDSSGNADDSASREYCIPGDTSTCNPPVGRWDFNEGTGSTVNDISGNNNTGTWNGAGSHWTQGKIGKGGSFNGSDDYVNCGNDGLTFTNGITISVWVNASTVQTTYPKFINSNVFSLQGSISGAPQVPTFGINIGGTWYPTYGLSSEWTTDEWVYYTGTYDNSVSKLYKNGALIKENTNPSGLINAITSNVYLGVENGLGSTTFFNGSIDAVRIYDYARTPAQIAWDYNRGKPVAHWKFDECQGGTAYDASGNGNDGTITIGGTGDQTDLGTCTSGTSSAYAWGNGVDGKYSSAMSFDGADDWVGVADNDILDLSNFTLEAWIKRNSFGTLQGVIIKGNVAANADLPYALYFDSDNSLDFNIGNDSTYFVLSGKTITDTNWHHIIATANGSIMIIYIDGILNISTSQTISPFESNEVLLIGSITTTSYPFDGLIDDVKIYNYALTAEQVKMEYNGGAVRFE